LADANVWLAFVADGHGHHDAAVRWMEGLPVRTAALCRVTQMGLLRLLTNARVMGRATLSPAAAWQVYEELQKDERVIFLSEPSGLEERWRELTLRRTSSVNLWADCYLRAFAEVRGIQVSTIDPALAAAAQSGALLLA
jgi:uncharacterized protein